MIAIMRTLCSITLCHFTGRTRFHLEAKLIAPAAAGRRIGLPCSWHPPPLSELIICMISIDRLFLAAHHFTVATDKDFSTKCLGFVVTEVVTSLLVKAQLL